MQEKIFPAADRLLAGDQAEATLHLNDGQVLEVRIEHATGSAANPMTNEQLTAKFRSMTMRALSEERANQLLEVCRNLGSMDDALGLFRLGAL